MRCPARYKCSAHLYVIARRNRRLCSRMKTLLISVGLTALAGTASAFPRVFVAPPAIVISGPECRPVAVGRYEGPARYVEPRVAFRGRTEVVERREPICRAAPVCRPVVVHPIRRR